MRISRVALVVAGAAAVALAARDAAAACYAPKAGYVQYSVKVDSAPQGAAVYVNDRSCPAVGVTPWEGKLNFGDYTIIVEAPGYDAATRPMKIAKTRKLQDLFVPLVKKANPPRIDIKADADPKGMAGATVMLDGEVKGQAPIVIVTTAGRHQLRIQKDGYEAYEVWVTATDNDTQTMLPQLKEIAKPKFGVVVVDADVPDAEVYIDGNKHPDNTPAVINNVIEGLHVIEVRKAPGLPWKQTVEVKASQQTKVRAELLGGMTGGVGVVRVLSDAKDAHAFLDGTDMGPVPVDIKDIKAGPHIIQVKAPGMTTGERQVIVAAGQSKTEKFDLNADLSGEQGILKVVSTVTEAQVFVDGAAVGKVPYEKRISAGEHPVVVTRDGFKQFQQKVRVEAGQTVTVQADLKSVGRLRILTNPAKAKVSINGIEAGKTPFDSEIEVGETVVSLELAGFQRFEQTIMIEGGKTEVISRELAIAGLSEEELRSQQRGLSSYGARTLPRGRSTVDFIGGYPYFFEGRVTVGAGKIAKRFGFDANVAVRTMFARTDLGIGARAMLGDNGQFSGAVFTNGYYGSKLLDNSGRNGLTWDIGGIVSLTAPAHVTISFRGYVEIWSDRHCPGQASPSMMKVFDGDPLSVCAGYYNSFVSDPTMLVKDAQGNMPILGGQDLLRVQNLTGWKTQSDVFGREANARAVGSIITEVAADQHWSLFGIFEAATGTTQGGERPLFVNTFYHSMLERDYGLYLRLGVTYKF
jgi:hypothetical protein